MCVTLWHFIQSSIEQRVLKEHVPKAVHVGQFGNSLGFIQIINYIFIMTPYISFRDQNKFWYKNLLSKAAIKQRDGKH